MKRNIFILYMIKGLKWAMFLAPLIVPFYFSRWLDTSQVFLLQSIFAISVVFLEIPTWFIGDKIWRKQSVLIGSVFSFWAWFLLIWAQWFWTLALTELLMAFWASFYSWSDSALLYDTLIENWEETRYKKISGKYFAIWTLAASLSSLIGWWLWGIDFLYAIYAQLILYMFAFILVLFLIEPERHKLDKHESAMTQIKRILQYSYWHAEIKRLIIIWWLINASTLTSFWIFQPYLLDVWMPTSYFWILFALITVVWAISSIYAHDYEVYLWRKWSLLSMPIIIMVAYLVLGFFPSLRMSLIFFWFQFVRWIVWVVMWDYVNKLVDSSIRATVLSLQSLSMRFFFAVIGPIMGQVSDSYWVSIALVFAGLLYWTAIFFSLWRLSKNNVL